MGPYPGMRTDLSMTIALNGPDAYKGGELVLETPFGDQKYKLAAGDAVLYPTHYMHQVMPVTGGRRLAVITWIESMVPDPAQREIIADLAQSMEIMINSEADAEAIRLLEKDGSTCFECGRGREPMALKFRRAKAILERIRRRKAPDPTGRTRTSSVSPTPHRTTRSSRHGRHGDREDDRPAPHQEALCRPSALR